MSWSTEPPRKCLGLQVLDGHAAFKINLEAALSSADRGDQVGNRTIGHPALEVMSHIG